MAIGTPRRLHIAPTVPETLRLVVTDHDAVALPDNRPVARLHDHAPSIRLDMLFACLLHLIEARRGFYLSCRSRFEGGWTAGARTGRRPA